VSKIFIQIFQKLKFVVKRVMAENKQVKSR